MTDSEIRKYDPEDVELKAIMGEKFQDKSQEAPIEPVKTGSLKASVSAEDKTEAEEGDTERKAYFLFGLKNSMSILGFACLTLLVFFWQDAGLMDISIAEPSMCVCSALTGFSIGKFVRGWK